MAANMNEDGSETMIETSLNCAELIELEYPGVVRNVPKMLDTMGGEAKISKAFSNDQALCLRYQPNNPYCKPSPGVATRTTSLLMKVKRRYKRSKADESGTSSEGYHDNETTSPSSEYSAEILGLVGQKYEFPNMCDFQYLPYAKSESGQMESFIEKILPTAGEDLSYVDREVGAFMLPESFSRFDRPINYSYKQDVQPREPADRDEPEFRAKLIQHGRNKRPNHAFVVSDVDSFKVPQEPHPEAVRNLAMQKSREALEEVKKMFEKRPLWSRNAIFSNTTVSTALMKGILCVVAYYFQQGPWRGLWCRMGYDPRTDPQARQYQLLDFRIRKELTDKRLKLLLKKKTTRISYPHSGKPRKGTPTPLIGSRSDQEHYPVENKDAYYIMRRGMLPAYHQMFYQLCDLHDPELQAIINDPRWHRDTHTSRTGYFQAEMFRILRDALTKMIKETVLGLNAPEENQGEAQNSDEPSTSTSITDSTDLQRGAEEDEDLDDEEEDDVEELEEREEGGEESESENEMEMEMLELMDSEQMLT